MRTAADIVKKNDRDIISAAPDTTLYDALQSMGAKRLGAIMVKDGD